MTCTLNRGAKTYNDLRHFLRHVAAAAFRYPALKPLTPPTIRSEGLGIELKSGTVLSCQDLVVQVLLPQWVLTSVFGMGTGGSPTP